MLKVRHVARRTKQCARTASTVVAAWFHAWEAHRQRVAKGEPSAAPRVPETWKQRTGGRGRPSYAVDEKGFEAWVRNGVPANAVAVAVASERAA